MPKSAKQISVIPPNQSIQKILIEIFSVVFGVLLALGINQWNQDRTNRATTRVVLENIKSELQSNRDLLSLIHENNKETVQIASDPVLSKSDTIDDRTIVPGVQLQETAWSTLMSANVTQYVEYETLYLLSQAYSMQENYKKMGMALLQGAMNSASYAAVGDKVIRNDAFTQAFLDYFTMFVQMETQLLINYKEALEQLGVPSEQTKGDTDSVHTQ